MTAHLDSLHLVTTQSALVARLTRAAEQGHLNAVGRARLDEERRGMREAGELVEVGA